MKGNEFSRKVQKLGRRHRINVVFVHERGKWSHGTLYYGDRLTIVHNPKDGVITGTLHAMLTQFGLTLADLTNRYEAIMRTFLYPAILTPDTEHGGFVVTFPDVPEGITQGDDIPEALKQAADCLDEAVAGRIRRHEPIPEASAVGQDQYAISLPISTGLKAALYLALQQAKITQSELAAHLHCDEQEVTRLLDPRRTANLSRLELALKALGYQLVLEMQAMIIPPCSVPSGEQGKHDGMAASPHAVLEPTR